MHLPVVGLEHRVDSCKYIHQWTPSALGLLLHSSNSCAILLPVTETSTNEGWLTLPVKCQRIRFQIQRVSAEQLLFSTLTSEILLISVTQPNPAVTEYSILQFNLQRKLITHLLNRCMKSQQWLKHHSHPSSFREAVSSPHLLKTIGWFL